MSSSNRLVVAIVVVAVLAIAFWMALLSPARKEASDLSAQVTAARQSLAVHESEVSQALEARREFAADYQDLILLGKAVPGDDDTASLLVQINRIARRARVGFTDLTLAASGGEGEEAPAPVESESSEGSSSPISPTEAAASTMPLGAAIGPAGLAVMPYELKFKGDFFQLADFLKGLDSLVKTENERVAVSGRLMTVDSFSLSPDQIIGFPMLEASIAITTYLTPPGEGVTGGASPEAPEATESAPVSTTTGGTP
jgi:Tfp pilus assembly protein PilO